MLRLCRLSLNPNHKLLFKMTNLMSFENGNHTSSKESDAMAPTSRIDPKLLATIKTPELIKLADIFSRHNFQIRIAGGAVRDLVLGNTPHDIDFASNATPEEMKEMFDKEEVRLINRNGETHGTITARIDDKENFEVTTLRIDVVTDGRHATVQFTKDWLLDAERRDLTVNSMFLDLDGGLYDFFNGETDLRQGKVRFVKEPRKRIQEDYLRILRYFRFFGRISQTPDDHCPDTIAAISENSSCLAGISGERLWMELKKIVGGPHACPILHRMHETGCFPPLGLPDSSNLTELDRVMTRTEGLQPHYCTILAALFTTKEQIETFHKRIKPSNDELSILLFLVTHREDFLMGSPPPLSFFQDHFLMSSADKRTFTCLLEALKYLGLTAEVAQFTDWTPPRFPVNGHKLKPWGLKGREVGRVLTALKVKWKDSGYTATEADLMSEEVKQEVMQT